MSPKQLRAFTAWAIAQGAEQQALTNPWEVLRLKVEGGVAVIYKNKSDGRTFNDLAKKLHSAFLAGESMPCAPKRARRNRNRKRFEIDVRTIRGRDGNECFFCGIIAPDNNCSIEHLVPVAHGGPDHLSNKFLAHHTCNQKAGHLSAAEKIRMRDQMRAATARGVAP